MGRSHFRPDDRFNPRNVIRHPGVNPGRVYAAAVLSERRYADLSVHASVIGVGYLERTAGIALWKQNFRQLVTTCSEHSRGKRLTEASAYKLGNTSEVLENTRKSSSTPPLDTDGGIFSKAFTATEK